MHEHDDCQECVGHPPMIEALLRELKIENLRLRSKQRYPSLQQAIEEGNRDFETQPSLVDFYDLYLKDNQLCVGWFTPEGHEEIHNFGALPEPVDVDKIDMVKSFLACTDLPVTIVFTKADKSERTLVHVRTLDGLKDRGEDEPVSKSVASRKKNNPGLLSVFDSQLHESGTPAEQCWRSVKIETIKTLTTGGVTLSLG